MNLSRNIIAFLFLLLTLIVSTGFTMSPDCKGECHDEKVINEKIDHHCCHQSIEEDCSQVIQEVDCCEDEIVSFDFDYTSFNFSNDYSELIQFIPTNFLAFIFQMICFEGNIEGKSEIHQRSFQNTFSNRKVLNTFCVLLI